MASKGRKKFFLFIWNGLERYKKVYAKNFTEAMKLIKAEHGPVWKTEKNFRFISSGALTGMYGEDYVEAVSTPSPGEEWKEPPPLGFEEPERFEVPRGMTEEGFVYNPLAPDEADQILEDVYYQLQNAKRMRKEKHFIGALLEYSNIETRLYMLLDYGRPLSKEHIDQIQAYLSAAQTGREAVSMYWQAVGKFPAGMTEEGFTYNPKKRKRRRR
jgi:hypothetical protein